MLNPVYSYILDIYDLYIYISTKLNSSKYYYAQLTIQSNISHLLNIQLNDQTVLFLTIQFSINPLF